ncbi:MAG: hypothetical protein AAF074_20470 [Pseudomonadota bacterium]
MVRFAKGLMRMRRLYWGSLRASWRNFEIVDPEDGSTLLRVERAALRDGALTLEGWSRAGDCTVEAGRSAQRVALQVRRSDVDAERPTGFVARVPADARPMIALRRSGETLGRAFPPPAWPARGRAAVRMAWRGCRAGGLILAALRGGRDAAWRDRLDRALGLAKAGAEAFDPSVLDPAAEQPAPSTAPASVVVAATDPAERIRLVEALLAVEAGRPYRLCIVAGPGETAPAALDALSSAAEEAGVPVATVAAERDGLAAAWDAGLSAAVPGDVALLWPGTRVPDGWLRGLSCPSDQRSRIASVSPLSDRGLLAVPMPRVGEGVIPAALSRAQATARRGARLAAEIPAASPPVVLVTAHGRSLGLALDRSLPGPAALDAWSEAATRAGAGHLGAGGVIVPHPQATAAAPAARSPDRAMAEARFARDDPLRSARLLLALRALGSGPDAVPVYLAHRWGGGAELWLQDRISRHLAEGQGAAVLRDDPAEGRYRLEAHAPGGAAGAESLSLAPLEQALEALPRRHIVYSCLVGARDPLGLLARLTGGLGAEERLTVLLHDHYPLCPSFSLLDAHGRYCALPEPAPCAACYRRLPARERVRPGGIEDWRAGWDAVLARAERIEAFSQDTAALFSRVYPQHAERLVVAPHRLPVLPRPVRAVDAPARRVIGVPGTIGHSKGAGVLAALADRADPELLRLVVIGRLEPGFAHPAIREHGPYRREDLSELAEHYALTDWMVPSIWPETFSYTTHEALATGLPVWGFALGAQGEALARASNGHVIAADPEDTAGVLAALLHRESA